MGYLLEELRDADNYEAFKKDVSDTNIFIGSLIFIEELADKVRAHAWHGWVVCARGTGVRACLHMGAQQWAAWTCNLYCVPATQIGRGRHSCQMGPDATLCTTCAHVHTHTTHGTHPPRNLSPTAQIVQAIEPLRSSMDACLVFPSMPAVMKLNKLGTFNMSQLGGGKSIIGDFIKSARKNNDNFEEGLLKLVRTLPKVRLCASVLSWKELAVAGCVSNRLELCGDAARRSAASSELGRDGESGRLARSAHPQQAAASHLGASTLPHPVPSPRHHPTGA